MTIEGKWEGTVGVVGAGVIGIGVIQDLAQTNHAVVAVDTDRTALEAAELTLKRAVRTHHLVGGGEPMRTDDVIARVTFTTDLEEIGRCDFVIENATEDWAVKEPIWRTLDAICPDSATLAANTSVVPITKFGSVTARPEQVVGIHFMNPVPLKPAVEVIRGHHTSEATLATTERLLSSMGKSSIIVNDSPGFVSNRVLMLTINEAAYLVAEGVAEAADVDSIFRDCFGHAMGPLETADLIGIDTIRRSIEMLWHEFHDSKYRPCPLLTRMEQAGLLGRKSGEGFYTYPGGKR